MELRTALTGALAIGCTYVCSTWPADAQMHYEAPRQYWNGDQSSYYQSPRGWFRQPFSEPSSLEQDRQSERQRPRLPSIRVQSPQYYVYAPDQPIAMPLRELALVETASRERWTGEVGSFSQARIHLESYSLRALPEVGEAIVAHYSTLPNFIWVDGGRANRKANEALIILEKADEFGLSSADYRVSTIEDRLSSGKTHSEALISFEMELSAATITYVLDASRGRIDPNRISGYHDLPRHKIALVDTLRAISETDNVSRFLRDSQPINSQFRALTAELARLRSADGQFRSKIAADTFMRPGELSEQIPLIVAAVRGKGSDELKRKHATILSAYEGTTEYGAELVALVRDFQREQGLAPDGIVGSSTVKALMRESRQDRVQKIELAMERLRWLPRDLGNRHVFINQPAFTAYYVEDGQSVLSMRTIVGKKETQTYFFSDRVQYVEYNPSWNVPHSIVVNKMVPQLLANPHYLDRQGYEVINGSGRRVSGASIDWYRVASKHLSVTVRQPPSRANALGSVKIMFPNKHAIYMHDTPDKKLFGHTQRTLSNGCIRLENARTMAAAVLGKNVEYVDSRIATGKTTADQLTDELPVHVAYFTAWPNSTGKVEYFSDIYGRDEYLARAAELTKSARAAR